MAMADGWQEQKVLNEVFPGRTGARTKSSYKPKMVGTRQNVTRTIHNVTRRHNEKK